MRDVFDHDAAITAFSASDNLVEAGKTTADVNVTDTNRGVENLTQGDYSVVVYAGKRGVYTDDVTHERGRSRDASPPLLIIRRPGGRFRLS